MTAGVRDIYDARIADGLVPERRWGSPTTSAASSRRCCAATCPYATGTVIHVDGGLVLPRL